MSVQRAAWSTPVTLVRLLIINSAPVHPLQRPDLADKLYGRAIVRFHGESSHPVLEMKAHSSVLRGAEGTKR